MMMILLTALAAIGLAVLALTTPTPSKQSVPVKADPVRKTL